MARLARIGRNLLVVLCVVAILAGAAVSVVSGKLPTPAMFGIDVNVSPSAKGGENDSGDGPGPEYRCEPERGALSSQLGVY